MTTANKITILRILLVPFFVVQVLFYVENGEELHRWLAIAAFGIATISDGLDGFIARRFNQRSALGAFLDPLADKLLLLSGIILFSINNEPYFYHLPLWFTATIISRDVMVSMGIAIVHFTCSKVALQPRLAGKTGTVFQMIVVCWTLLQWERNILHYWLLTAAALTTYSGILYLFDGMKQLSTSPASAPKPDQR